MKWLKNNRQTFLPWVRDWTDPQDKIRNTVNVNGISQSEWFWLHPSSFKLIYFGTPITSIVIFTAGSILSYMWGSMFMSMLLLVFDVILVADLAKKLKNSKITPNMTMYDMYLRDWDE